MKFKMETVDKIHTKCYLKNNIVVIVTKERENKLPISKYKRNQLPLTHGHQKDNKQIV